MVRPQKWAVVTLIAVAVAVAVAGGLVAAAALLAISAPADGPASGAVAVRGAAFDAAPLGAGAGAGSDESTGAAPPGPSDGFPCDRVDVSPLNAFRIEVGLAPLDRSPALEAEACAWSLHLVGRGELVHGAPNEMLYRGPDPRRAFDAWRASPAHHAIMLSSDPRVSTIGCAAARTAPGPTVQYYVTCRMSF